MWININMTKSIGKLDIDSLEEDELWEMWKKSASNFAPGDQYKYASQAISHILYDSRYSGYVMVDDDDNTIISVLSYREESVSNLSRFNLDDRCSDEIQRYFSGLSKVYFLARLSGTGKYAAYSTMKDMMQIAKIDNVGLILESDYRVSSFYDKLGFYCPDLCSDYLLYLWRV